MNPLTFPRALVIGGFSALTAIICHAAPIQVGDSTLITHEKTGIKIVKGTVSLPRGGYWMVEQPFSEHDGLIEVYPNWEPIDLEGSQTSGRMAKIMDRRAIRDRQYKIHRVFYDCERYAREHQGIGPAKLSDITAESRETDTDGIYLIPQVRILEPDEDGDLSRDYSLKTLLLIDTTPAIDDGKQWRSLAGGSSERFDIDLELMKKHGLTLKPQNPPHADRASNQSPSVQVDLYARLIGAPGVSTFTVLDPVSKKTLEVEWDTTKAAPGKPSIVEDWIKLRVWNFQSYLKSGAPLSRSWLATWLNQYQLPDDDREQILRTLNGPRQFRRNRVDVMSVLGGRAAIDETLQLRNLQIRNKSWDLAGDASVGPAPPMPIPDFGDGSPSEDSPSPPVPEPDWRASIPVDEITGVEVEAHPFEKMLAGKEGGKLALAEWIPADHLMVYLPQPKKIFAMLDGTSDFIFNAGSGATGRSFSYQLKQRYQKQMGLSEKLIKQFLKSGAIEEIAITVPDLFLIDGTEVSAVMRTGKPLLTSAALAIIGVPPGDGKTIKKNDAGESVYWIRSGDILIVSSDEAEADAIVAAKQSGENLGKSAELRYMLTQVGITPDTLAYTYFSDPFIRRLVGPRSKIGQLRRVMARAELEEASGASLLASFDGHGKQASELEFLQQHHYLRKPLYADDLVLDESALSHSARFGRAARMHSLNQLPIKLVSPEENKAYELYLEQYNDFWGRFFDPIAIRYEKNSDGQHQLETFILPLINNSLYAGLRQFLPAEDEQIPLLVPRVDPPPIALLSCNLKEETWIAILDDLDEDFLYSLGLDPALLDQLGPDIHLTLQDADPIITIGNGEMQNMLGSFGGDGEEMLMISGLASISTRPCTVQIGLQDPDKVRRMLADMSWAPAEDDEYPGFGSGSLYQVTGKEKWIYKYSIANIITLRLGIEVQDRYLVINNQPFGKPVVTSGHRRIDKGAAYLELSPSACELQLPALFASAVDQMRSSALSGAACLMPLMVAGEPDIEAAMQRHRELFGFAPLHPGGGAWTWNSAEGDVVSSLYGSIHQNHQPEFDPDNKEVGLMKRVSQLDVSMQFEQDGLRSTLRWKTK